MGGGFAPYLTAGCAGLPTDAAAVVAIAVEGSRSPRRDRPASRPRRNRPIRLIKILTPDRPQVQGLRRRLPAALRVREQPRGQSADRLVLRGAEGAGLQAVVVGEGLDAAGDGLGLDRGAGG